MSLLKSKYRSTKNREPFGVPRSARFAAWCQSASSVGMTRLTLSSQGGFCYLTACRVNPSPRLCRMLWTHRDIQIQLPLTCTKRRKAWWAIEWREWKPNCSSRMRFSFLTCFSSLVTTALFTSFPIVGGGWLVCSSGGTKPICLVSAILPLHWMVT